MRQRELKFFPNKKLCNALRRLQTQAITAAHHDVNTVVVRRTDIKILVELFPADLLDDDDL